jgi:hypothetical protein
MAMRGTAMANPPKIFISYSHKDGRWLDEFQTHLTPSVRGALIDTWADTRLAAGTKWKDEIQKALAEADIGVLLVTPDFLASDFIAKHELPPLLAKPKTFWIAVSASNYEVTEIAQYQCANDPARPLDRQTRANCNAEWVKLCKKHWDAVSAPAGAPSAHPSGSSTPSKSQSDTSGSQRSPLGNPPSPALSLEALDFCQYTEDIVDGIKWTWRWKDGAREEPRINAIELTGCFCQRCGRRIEPKSRVETTEERIPGRPYAGIPTAGTILGIISVYDTFRCDNGCINLPRNSTRREEEDKVRRQIEHRSRNPAEWQAAPERIGRASR